MTPKLALSKKANIPFLAEWRELMLSGDKTATSRTHRYGKAGDTFVMFGTTFELQEVYALALSEVALNHYHREGCPTPEAFRRVWERIHPKRGYVGYDVVWFHVFKRVPQLPQEVKGG